MLPDGKTRVDMSVMLPELILSEMVQSQNKLRPRDATPVDDDKDRYILKGGLTSFEAENLKFSVKIGYKPGQGDVGSGSLVGVNGKVAFTIGTMEMDFHIIDTKRHEVVAVGYGSALTGGGTIGVELDFGVIKTPMDFVYNSPMAPHFRKAVREAVLKMANNPWTNFLMDWTSSVLRVNRELGSIFFSSGARDGIEVNNVFTIYDRDDIRIGEVKVRSAEHEQSSAAFKDDSTGKLLESVRAGDSVKIFFKDTPQ